MDAVIYEGVIESVETCLQLNKSNDFEKNLFLLVSRAMIDVVEDAGRNWCISFANPEVLSWV